KSDVFVQKVNPVTWMPECTNVLGGMNDDIGYGIAWGNADLLYIAGETASPNFPTTPGSWQPVFGAGPTDGFITALSPWDCKTIIFSTFLNFNFFGGPSHNGAYGVALDKPFPQFVNSVNVTGYTDQGGPIKHAFVFALDFSLSIQSFFPLILAGSGEDIGYGIAVDPFGFSHVTGSASFGFPTTLGPPYAGGPSDAFVTTVTAGGPCLVPILRRRQRGRGLRHCRGPLRHLLRDGIDQLNRLPDPGASL